MIVAILNVGTVPYAGVALQVIRDYLNRWDIRFFEVNQIEGVNHKHAHPSWVKLLMHQVLATNMEFILNWDLDLLPVKGASDIREHLDPHHFNMAIDSSLLAGFPGYNANFLYNGGLMGIPAEMASWCQHLYQKHAPGTYPSYEQYYLNDAIKHDNIPVHRIPPKFNTLYPRNSAGNALWRVAEFKHYTFGVMDANDKKRLMEEHARDYFSA